MEVLSLIHKKNLEMDLEESSRTILLVFKRTAGQACCTSWQLPGGRRWRGGREEDTSFELGSKKAGRCIMEVGELLHGRRRGAQREGEPREPGKARPGFGQQPKEKATQRRGETVVF